MLILNSQSKQFATQPISTKLNLSLAQLRPSLLYFSFKIIFKADFCTLSKSFLLSSVRELCQTVAECSNWLLTNRIYIFLSSAMLVPKLATFLSNSMRAFAFLTMWAVFSSHLRSSVIIVPSNLVLFVTSTG